MQTFAFSSKFFSFALFRSISLFLSKYSTNNCTIEEKRRRWQREEKTNRKHNIDFDCVMDSWEWRLKIEQFMLKYRQNKSQPIPFAGLKSLMKTCDANKS